MIAKMKRMLKADEAENIKKIIDGLDVLVPGSDFEVEPCIGEIVEKVIKNREKEITSIDIASDGSVSVYFDTK